MSSVQGRDAYIDNGSGCVFVRSWEREPHRQDASAPVVLLHDSRVLATVVPGWTSATLLAQASPP